MDLTNSQSERLIRLLSWFGLKEGMQHRIQEVLGIALRERA